MMRLIRANLLYPRQPRSLLVASLLLFMLPSCLLAQDEKKEDKDNRREEERKAAYLKVLQKAQDEYRNFFRKPEKAVDFWAAITFEIEVGKFDLAGLHLDSLLALEPAEEADRDLLKIEEAQGMSTFLRLEQIRTWSENPDLQKEAQRNVHKLIGRVTAALEKHLGDPIRLQKFIKNLVARTSEERAYAFVQIKRSGVRATPYLIDALRTSPDTLLHEVLRQTILYLPAEVMAPMLEVLHAIDDKDAKDPDLRYTVIDLFRTRLDRRATPYLWHIIGSPKYAANVRKKARETLSEFLGFEGDRLPEPKQMLVQLADRYYRHQHTFKEPMDIKLWRWDGEKIERKPSTMTAPQAEEMYLDRYIRQALELDPTYRPAQILMLTLLLQQSTRDRIESFILEPLPPGQHKLLVGIQLDLLAETLEKAFAERDLPVILPLVRILGDRGEMGAAITQDRGPARGLIRALYYPDVRVQYEAAKAMLRLPTTPQLLTAARIVHIQRRFLLTGPTPRALVLGTLETQLAEVRKALKDVGYDPILVKDYREAFAPALLTANIDAIFINSSYAQSQIPYALSQLRQDADVGLVPLVLLMYDRKETANERLAQRSRNVYVLPNTLLLKPEELKTRVTELHKFAAAPNRDLGLQERQQAWVDEEIRKRPVWRLTEPERKFLQMNAMEILARMGRGEITGYDLRGLTEALLEAMQNEELALPALETYAQIPSKDTQARLFELVLDETRPKLRLPAAVALTRNVQRNGVQFSRVQVDVLREVARKPEEDAKLKTQLDLLLSRYPRSPRLTGTQLQQFRPDPPPVKEKEKEKEKGD